MEDHKLTPLKPWPRVQRDDPAAEAEWRARMEERVDGLHTDLRRLVATVERSLRSRERATERCVSLVSTGVDRSGAILSTLVAGVLHPSRGLIVLAILATIVLAGWSAGDVSTLVHTALGYGSAAADAP